MRWSELRKRSESLILFSLDLPPPKLALPMTTPTYLACPTEIVDAPVGVVWKLLTNISGWGSFFDLRVTRVEPPGPAAKGQRMLGETGPRWLHLGGSFEYTLIDETHYKLEMD